MHPSSHPPSAAPLSSVTVIGLGKMGRALAQTFMSRDLKVTVFNRTPSRASYLQQHGALLAPSMSEALRANTVAVLCVADYEAAASLLGHPGVDDALKGRIVVQLSTGTPQQARTFAERLSSTGAAYLDGALLVTPSQIGTSEGAALVAGHASTFERVQPLLALLGPGLQYVGTDPGAAAALDLAFLSHFFGGLLGFYHGARLLESEKIPVTQLGEMIHAVAPALGSIIQADARRIEANTLDAPESSLANSATIVELLLRQAGEARLDPRFPEFAVALFRAGMARGHGRRDVAALMEVLRSYGT